MKQLNRRKRGTERAATEGRPYSCLHKTSVYIRLHVAGA
jgi:hypothetical protein